MNDTLFLQHCDPRLGYTEQQVLSLLNLHALLSKEIVVQDNFLISKLFFDVIKTSPNQSFQVLLSEKILNIASRDNFDHSLLNLKNDLLNKAINKKYMPFEGPSGIELYKQKKFENYVQQLDKSLKNCRKNFRSWSPDKAGKDLRNRMLESAENETSGLEPETAKNVVNSIDLIALENGKDLIHSRSMYFDYIKTLSDKQLADKIWAWVSYIYLKNLPDKLSIGLSLSSKTLVSGYSYDPFEFAKNKELFDRYNDLGNISSAIFCPDFLVNLHPKSIIKIREFDEFKNLQKVINGNDKNKKISSLTEYFSRLSDEAPKFYEPFRKKIRNLEILEKTKFKLLIASEVFAIASTFTHAPFFSGIINGLLILLKHNKTIENLKEKTTQLSKSELYRIKLDNEIKNLGDVCHQLENNS